MQTEFYEEMLPLVINMYKRRRIVKRLRNFLKAAEIAAGTGIFLLEQSKRMTPRMRDKLSDSVDDLRGFAKDAYGNVSDRVSNLTRRRNDHSAAWNLAKFAAGIGIGVGIGLLFAPDEGERTRSQIAEKAQELSQDMRSRFNRRAEQMFPATGTGD
jgi:gas vesicle protein